MAKDMTKWRLAVHEAGHGLAARHVGNKVTSISIKRGPGFDGAARNDTYEGATEYTAPERFIIVNVAGYVAERLVIGDNDPGMCQSDRENAWQGAVGQHIIDDAAALAAGQRLWEQRVSIDDERWPKRAEATKLIGDMEAKCRGILEARRPELERLARHLEKYEECVGEDVEAICAGT